MGKRILHMVSRVSCRILGFGRKFDKVCVNVRGSGVTRFIWVGGEGEGGKV